MKTEHGWRLFLLPFSIINNHELDDLLIKNMCISCVDKKDGLYVLLHIFCWN